MACPLPVFPQHFLIALLGTEEVVRWALGLNQVTNLSVVFWPHIYEIDASICSVKKVQL